ncbi:hypothetical protein [Croceicoccus sp. BE223]|uniref:hypothetical protein n=1 Tax=Croceicoccus sp. BE223 TaxID=2817716 RepID=UPI002865A740|nr:hypothetical protein [Croceicoccus sp. BE223]MDR7102591.1 putative hemolysin [Croceicoccus sp. BE223]
MRAFLLAPALLIVAACTQASAQSDQPIAAPDAQGPVATASVDAATCKAAGGFLDRRGRMQSEICVHPYADAGKACRDSQECDGKCVTGASPEPGEAADGQLVGQCQADDALFGCYAEVVDGKRVRAICVD